LDGAGDSVLDLILGDLDELLGIVELLLDDQGVDHFTGLARSEAVVLAALRLRDNLLLLNYVCLLLLLNYCILHCTWNVIRVNDEIVDVNLNKPRRGSVFLTLNHLRAALRINFLGINPRSRGRLSGFDKIPANYYLSSSSGSRCRILLLLISHKAAIVVAAFLLHEWV
jgi:hypothetical protein